MNLWNPLGPFGLRHLGKTPPYLIKGLVPKNSLVLFSADPFTGKTFLSLEMARCIAFGMPFLGLPTIRGSILFVENDSPAWDLRAQMDKVMGDLLDAADLTGIPEKDLTAADLHHAEQVSRRLNFLVRRPKQKGRPNVDTDEGLATLVNTVRTIPRPEAEKVFVGFNPETGEPEFARDGAAFGVDLIVLDTLSTFHSADENDATQMSRVMDNLRILQAETGAAVMFLQHRRKPGQDKTPDDSNFAARGSTAILGAVDVHLALRRKGANYILSVPKGRGAQGDDILYTVTHSPARSVFTPVVADDNIGTIIMATLAECPADGASTGVILGKIIMSNPGISPAAARTRMHKKLTLLRAAGTVEHMAHGKYRLVQHG